MTILVTGATGTIGRHVVEQLVQRGAFVRDPARAAFPASVQIAQGDVERLVALLGRPLASYRDVAATIAA